MDIERYEVFSIANKANSDFDVVFIHGLGGDKFTTWQNSNGQSWQDWLAQDYNVSVHTIAYGANATNWIEHDMTLEQTADFLLSSLQHQGIGKKPYMFIVHSLGGLLAKRILMKADNQREHQEIANMCKAIVFFGVPHTGSGWATLLSYADPILRSSNLLSALPKDTNSLNEMALDFDNFMVLKGIETFVFYETNDVRASGILGWLHLQNGVRVVSITSATHVHSNNTKVSLPEDHISMCKFHSRDADIYKTKISAIMNKMTNISQNIEKEQEKKKGEKKPNSNSITQTHNDKVVNQVNAETIYGVGLQTGGTIKQTINK